MHRVAPRLSRGLLATALVAFAASGAAAAGNMFLKLHGVAGENPAAADHHDEQIEIHSVQWGSTPAAGGTFKGEITGIEPTYEGGGSSKARGGTNTVDANEKITIHGGRAESKLPGKRTPPTVTLKRGKNSAAAGRGLDIASVDGEIVSPGTAASAGDPDRPIVAGTVPNPSSAQKRKRQYASIQAGPMQYNPKEYSVSKSNNSRAAAPAALGRGSLMAVVPTGTCKVGARYPAAELGTGNRVYRMESVVVSGCSAAPSSNGMPMESLSLSYERIVR